MEKKESVRIARIVLIVVIFTFYGMTIRSAVAWTEPAAAPPNVNIGAPLTTGGIAQTKSRTIGINAWDSQYLAGFGVQKRSIGGANGWDSETLFINGWKDWANGVSIGGDTYIGGNANVNDVYIRAAGKWASQIAGGNRKYGLSCFDLASGVVARYTPILACCVVNESDGKTSCYNYSSQRKWRYQTDLFSASGVSGVYSISCMKSSGFGEGGDDYYYYTCCRMDNASGSTACKSKTYEINSGYFVGEVSYDGLTP